MSESTQPPWDGYPDGSPSLPVARKESTGVLQRAAKQHEHNIDVATEAGKTALMATANDPTYHWDNMPNEIMNVVYWRVHEADKTDDNTGEVSSGYRMILVLDTGETFATGSEWAFPVLSLAVDTFGREPWRPPVAFRASRKKSRANKWFLLLECLGRPVANTSKRK